MRKSIIACLLCLVCVLFCSCGNTSGKFVVKKCVADQSKNGFSMRYESFDGYKTYEYDLKKDDFVQIKVVTDSGALDVLVTDAEGTAYVDKRALGNDEYEFSASTAGKYVFRFTAKKHSGSFVVSW